MQKNNLVPMAMTLHSKKYNKIRDHCHYIGKYRDVAHNICNLR